MTTHYGIIGCGMMGQEHLSNIALLEVWEIIEGLPSEKTGFELNPE